MCGLEYEMCGLGYEVCDLALSFSPLKPSLPPLVKIMSDLLSHTVTFRVLTLMILTHVRAPSHVYTHSWRSHCCYWELRNSWELTSGSVSREEGTSHRFMVGVCAHTYPLRNYQGCSQECIHVHRYALTCIWNSGNMLIAN